MADWSASKTSTSICASALVASSPDPAATRCDSASAARMACSGGKGQLRGWAAGQYGRRTSGEKASRGSGGAQRPASARVTREMAHELQSRPLELYESWGREQAARAGGRDSQASTALMVSVLLGWTLANPPLTARENESARGSAESPASASAISPESVLGRRRGSGSTCAPRRPRFSHTSSQFPVLELLTGTLVRVRARTARWPRVQERRPTEPLLGLGGVGLDDLEHSRLERLDRRNVVGEAVVKRNGQGSAARSC